MLPEPRLRDPRQVTSVGWYLRDDGKTRLLRVLEVDYSGVIGEDVISDELVEISPQDLQQHWLRVRPLMTLA